MKKVKDLFENEAFKATGVRKVFFDEESIKWGNEFDVKIYEAIVHSCFFIPFYNYSHLHEEDLWCAKELYRGIKVEEKIQKEANGFCYFFWSLIGELQATFHPHINAPNFEKGFSGNADLR